VDANVDNRSDEFPGERVGCQLFVNGDDYSKVQHANLFGA